MPELRDYLELTPEQAKEQWTQILARPPRNSGSPRRQTDFTPVETLLCLMASLVVNSHRYGGKNAHTAPTPVPELAQLFARTPGSILNKMLNLDGSRANGARNEVAAASAVLSNLALPSQLYSTIMKAARDSGVTEDQLPDFLEVPITLLGQEELSDQDVAAAAREFVEPTDDGNDLGDYTTQRLRESSVRVGQHRFARDVLANWGYECVFCGLSPGEELAGRKLLRASHIKPWRASTNRERLDVRNGLAACPTHDAAFDEGLIFLTDDLEIRYTPNLLEAVRRRPGFAARFGYEHMRRTLPPAKFRPSARYLAWHRQQIAKVEPPLSDG
ncbi:MAG: HNH endonuclease [Frankia sp.]|nr:HNH endonuclease [Frankia sp.]